MVNVTVFGTIKIEYKGLTLTAADFNSDMLLKLFIYMIIHREGPIESEVICHELWPDGNISNPTGALKNLTYRLRNYLKKYYPEDNFILSTRGSYSWNPEIECQVDNEEFDRILLSAKSVDDKDEKLRLYDKAIQIYKGEFLGEIIDLRCYNVMKAYYHGIYIVTAKELCGMYFEAGNYSALNELCTRVVSVDRLEEQIYYYLIMSCVKTNDIQMGLEIYEKASKLLKKELGVKNLSSIDQAYEQLLALDKGGERLDLKTIKAQLLQEREPGPFFCGYAVFKEIFQLIIRQRGNCEVTGMMLLFTIDFSFDPSTGKIEKFKAEKIMKAFTDVLGNELRMGDIVSKYTEFQYVVLLNGCKPESVSKIMDRINNAFLDKYPQYSDAKIRCQVEKVETINNSTK